MKTLFIILATVLMFTNVWAIDLDMARGKGLVKELPSGYLEATNPKSKALADEINQKRKAHYEKIAKENNLTVELVGQQAAEKIQEKLKAK